jgi:hypothetical protein
VASASSVVFISPAGLSSSKVSVMRRALEHTVPIDSLNYSAKDNAESGEFIHVEIIRGTRGRQTGIAIIDINHVRMPV